MRIGGKQNPFYRVVAVDERAKRTGGYVELLGTYNPLTEPKDLKLKQDRIDYWIKQGAQPSVGYLRAIGKAPQKQPRKPKKEKKAEQPAAVSPQPADKTTEETQVQSAPAQTEGEPEKPEAVEVQQTEQPAKPSETESDTPITDTPISSETTEEPKP